MTEHTPQRPVKEFRAGTIRAAIWRNEILGDDGETTTRYSVRVEKTFRDSRSEQWRQTDYFFTDELPQLRLVADKAYEFIALREREPDSESEPTSANPDEFPNP